MPDRFLRKATADLGFTLPPRGRVRRRPGLPAAETERARRAAAADRADRSARKGTPSSAGATCRATTRRLGASARAAKPVIEQVFIADGQRAARPTTRGRRAASCASSARCTSSASRSSTPPIALALADDRGAFYIVSLSANTLIYKGMLTADQIAPTFPDLTDPDMESALALVHQRFSTNTFPSWPLAHPYRYVAHNGEINTLRGNINWMRAREGLLRSTLLGDDLKKILPVIREGGSDTATFDNVLELLVMSGRSLPHAILMMIPEPWSSHETMTPEVKAFYEFHSSLMEPWDGPASIAFTDGTVIGAVLDRNGLRPSRYYVTKDDLVIMASEVGVLDIPAEDILLKERLHPGRLFLVDTRAGTDRVRRRGQARARGRAALRALARRPSDRHRRSAGGAAPAAAQPRADRAAPAAVRLHAGRSARSCSRRWRRTAKSRSARWAPTRRWRCCRIARGCSTTTSSSCSRRSPTRRSTRFARSW